MPMKQLVSQQQEIQNFIASFKLPCELATRILRSKADCLCFKEDFYGRNPRRLTDDLLDFLEYQVRHNFISLDNFLMGCNVSPSMLKATFEQTFYEELSDEAMSMFFHAHLSGELSFTELYEKFKANPLKRIVSYVV